MNRLQELVECLELIYSKGWLLRKLLNTLQDLKIQFCFFVFCCCRPSLALVFMLHLYWSQIRGLVKYYHRFVELTVHGCFLLVLELYLEVENGQNKLNAKMTSSRICIKRNFPESI